MFSPINPNLAGHLNQHSSAAQMVKKKLYF